MAGSAHSCRRLDVPPFANVHFYKQQNPVLRWSSPLRDVRHDLHHGRPSGFTKARKSPKSPEKPAKNQDWAATLGADHPAHIYWSVTIDTA
jgi:hypothetical protein